MSAEKSGPGPKLGYWHLWTHDAGVSHQDQHELSAFELGVIGDAAPQWNAAQPRVDATVEVEPGMADGFRCDEHGNIWSSAADGVHCIDPSGELIGKIKVPYVVSNVAFRGRHRSRLFICGSQTLYAMYLNVRGAQRP